MILSILLHMAVSTRLTATGFIGYAIVLLLIGGCSSKVPGEADDPVLSPAQIKVKSAQVRSNWRKNLQWSNSCEDAFQASYVGQQSGVQVYKVDDRAELISVLCSAGAYQPSFVYFLLDQKVSSVKPRAVSFPIYDSNDGQHLNLVEQTEIWGEPLFDSGRGELNILNVARQSRDCGSWAVYGLDSGRAELLELWTRYPCPQNIQTPAEQRTGVPPTGWVRVDHELILD